MTLRAHLTPLRTPNFRWFFLGEFVNTSGTAMSGLALAFAVLAIDKSAFAVGLVAAASMIPTVAFMLIGGAIADRLPRALVLRGCNLLAGLCQAVAAALVLSGVAEVWHLVVLQFVTGTAFAIGYPAFHGMVPILLPEAERKAAYLLLAQSEGLLRIAGPAIAGVLVATAGPGWALAFDAVTFLAAAYFLSRLRLPIHDRPTRKESVIGDFVAGWQYSRALGWVIPVACASLFFNAILSGALGVLGPVLAVDTIGSDGWGLARAGQAAGLLLTTVVLARVVLRRPLLACLFGFSLVAAPMLVLGGWVATAPLTAAFMLSGAGLAVVGLAWNLTVQEKVDEEMLSRVMSIDGFFSFVAMPLGQVLVGPLAHAFGIQRVEYGSAALVLLVAAMAAAHPKIRGLRLTGAAVTRP